jgi:hypothetical protein
LKSNSDLHNPSSAISLICTFIAILSAWPCLKNPGAGGRRGKRRWGRSRRRRRKGNVVLEMQAY